MDSKQNGLTYVNTPLPSSVSSIKKQMPPTRTTSLLGISRLNGDHTSVYDEYFETGYSRYDKESQPHNLRNSHIAYYNRSSRYDYQYSENMPTLAERRLSSSTGSDTSVIKENLTRDVVLHPLKENLSNKDIFDYNEQWLCDVDLFREKMRAQHLMVNGDSHRRSVDRTRYSESAKDSSPTVDFRSYRIRARSESEPNDISNLKQWAPSSNRVNDPLLKRYRDEHSLSPPPPPAISNSTSNQLNTQRFSSNLKKDLSPRVLIYNHPPPRTPHSPAMLKRTTRLRSSPVLGSPRLNGMRKLNTKSPSPTFRGKTPIKAMSPIRKAKSATPPPRSIKDSLPFQPVIVVNSKTHPTIERSDTDCSSLDDDDDFDDDNNDADDSSSDSENGYRNHVYLTDSEKSLSPLPILVDSSVVHNRGAPATPFVCSMFPYVPPYLTFSSYTEKGPPMPQQLQKILKWKLTSIMPRVVRRILTNSGFRLLKKTNEWMGTWGKHMKSPCFKTIRSYQKINHIPGSFKIGRKDSCWRNLQMNMAKYGKKEFGFMPKTYVIPQDLKQLRKAWPKYSQRNFKWIIKPPASARGTGIKVVNRWSQIPKRKPIIVQKYIERPLLINGSKFDLRLYVLVTSINPLRVYMYNDGLTRFASVKYSEKSDTLSDRCMHLTNYSINKLSSNYTKNEDANACQGHKWTIKSLWSYLAGRGVNTNRLWSALRNLVLRTILAGENSIHTMIKMNVESKYNCFELFGFDVILDSELVPWLLEVNISPSLHSELPLDLHVKGPLVQAVFNTALYHVPPKLSAEHQKEVLAEHDLKAPLCYDKRLYVTHLSRAEKVKHNQFTRKTLEDRDDYLHAILENLTPDDVRCLITTEDELARCAPLERIFPGPNTYKYLKYTETPRYYNRLLDAWEHRYSRNRSAGIRNLQELCEQKYHLEVPPAPVKKQLKIRTRALRRRKTTKSTVATTLMTVNPTKCSWSLKTAVKSIKRKNKRQNARFLLKQESSISTITSAAAESESSTVTSVSTIPTDGEISPSTVPPNVG